MEIVVDKLGSECNPDGHMRIDFGFIPEDWTIERIGPKIDLLTGNPFSSSGYSDSGTRLLRCANIKRGNTDWSDDITRYWPEVTPDLNKYQLEENDVVIAMDGSLVGRSYAIVKDDDLPALLLQRAARIRSQFIDTRYLKYFIGSDWFIKYCDSVKTNTAVPHISAEDIRNFEIPLPPTLEEQRAIAEALSDVDDLLASLDALIEKKQQIKKGAMQQLLTGKTRLSGFEGEWEEKTFDDCFNFLKSGTNSRKDLSENGSVGYIHYGDIHAKWSQSLDCKRDSIPKINREKVKNLPRVEDGDLILADASEDYDGVGAGVEVKNLNGRAIVAGLHTILLRAKDYCIADGYKAYITSIATVKKRLTEIATGTTVYGISKNKLKQVEIYLPPTIEEQKVIAQILSDMDEEINALQAKRSKYEKIKQGMMQELLTGKTRLV
ncbi:MAG: restriction endonuclease subunit S [Bacteroidota bacterium]